MYERFLFVVLLTPNIARNGKATQSSNNKHAHHSDPGYAKYAIDGNFNTNTGSSERCTHTKPNTGAWWQVDLLQTYQIYKISITNREGHTGKILQDALNVN